MDLSLVSYFSLKALSAAISSEESYETCLTLALIGTTALIAVGLIIELLPDIRELCSLWRYRDTSAAKQDVRKALWTVIGTVVITVAIAGELILQVLLLISQSELRSFNTKREAALLRKVEVAEMHAADRVITDLDMIRFSNVSVPINGIRVFVLKNDREAKAFAESILQVAILGPQTLLKYRDIEEIDDPRLKLQLGTMLPGIFGPFGGDDHDPKIISEKQALYFALSASGFCIVPDPSKLWGIGDLADKSPSIITLVIGPKNRTSNCR